MNLDIAIFNLFHSLIGKSICFDSLAIFFAQGFIWILGIAAISIVIFLYRRRPLSKIFFFGLGTFVLSYICLLLIQYLYFRPRPFVALKINPLIDLSTQNPSLPSFHTILAFIIALVVYAVNKKWGIVFLVFATLVGLARVLVGVHWFSDVLASVILVLLSSFLIKKFLKNINL
jgi:undecaprenyl-diphosphatase